MTYSHRCRFFWAMAGISLTFMPPAANEDARGQEVLKPDDAGIIWCIGAIQSRSDGQPTIDMGDAYALAEGNEVSVFRSQDGHFRPLGVLRIGESFSTWSIPVNTRQIELQSGDRVIYVRTLSGMGTGEDFREGYLRQQIVKKGIANGYSTAAQLEEAQTLQGYFTRHPRWIRESKHIAGTIRSAAISRKDLQEMQPLLRQIMKLQDYEKLGVPIEKAIGAEWQAVIRNLEAPADEFELEAPAAQVASTDATEDAAVSTEAAMTVNEQRLEAIRRITDQLLFLRTPEERKLVTILCTALEKSEPRNERQWFSLQIASSQFQYLADDAQFLDDLETVIRRVRQAEQ